MSIFKSTFPDFVKNQLLARQKAMVTRTPQNLSYINSRNAWVRMTSSVNVNGSNVLAQKYVLMGGTLNANKNMKSGLGDNFAYAYSNKAQDGTSYRYGIRPMPGITNLDIKSKSAYGSLREAVVKFQCWDIKQLEDLEVLYMRPGYTVLVEWGWAPYILSDGSYNSTFYDFYDIINKPQTNRTVLFQDLYNKCKKYEGNYDAMFGYIKNYQWSARADGGWDCETTVITTGEIIESLKINYPYPTLIKTETESKLNAEFGNTTATSTDWINAYQTNALAGIWSELFYRIGEPNFGGWTKGDGVMLAPPPSFLSSNIDNDKSLSKDGNQRYIVLEEVFRLLNQYIIAKSSADKEPLVKLSLKSKNPVTGVEEDLLCVAQGFQLSVDPGICLIKNPNWADSTIIKGVEDAVAPDAEDITAQAANIAQRIIDACAGSGTDPDAINDAINDIVKDIEPDTDFKGDPVSHSAGYNAGDAKAKAQLLYGAVDKLIKNSDLEGHDGGLAGLLNAEYGRGTWVSDGNLGDLQIAERSLSKAGITVKYDTYDDSFKEGSININVPSTAANVGASKTIIATESSKALANVKFIGALTRDYFVGGKTDSEVAYMKNIYVNIDHLYLKALSTDQQSSDDKGKEEINLYGYVKGLMQDIQSAIGNINNFEIHVDPIDNNVARVIDVNYTEQTKATYSKLYMLPIQELDSTARSFSLQSQIFPNQAAMVAIGSQAKATGAMGVQANTLIDFNQNLTDRILPQKEDGINSAINLEPSEADMYKTNATNGIAKIIDALAKDNTKLGNGTDSYDSTISDAKTGLRDIIAYMQSLTKAPGSNRNIIPTKFSCEIDGIGGLVIGNMFKLPGHLLPKGYKGIDGIGSQLGNAITGISHTINGGDWTTKIESQNIVL